MIKKINLKYIIIAWVIIIFILSSISGNSLNKIPKIKIPHLDKIVHFIMYFTLQSLLILEYYKNFTHKYKSVYFIVISLVISVLYSAFMEVLQEYFFVKRSGDFFDLLANSIGAITGTILMLFLINKTTILNKIIK